MPVISDVLTDIVANLLYDKFELKDRAWLIMGLFIVIVAAPIAWKWRKWWKRRQVPLQDRRLALDHNTRQSMLKTVRANWINDFLQPSLVHEDPIDLDLAERAAAVVHPLDRLVQRPHHADREFPRGMRRILELFDEFNQALLILGAQGVGKTTLLLMLARRLLDRAEQDPTQTHPIPVVFLLSSWAANRRTLADWLIDELYEQYYISRNIAQALVVKRQILPLLDGLDAVRVEHRAACVEAINCFRQEHGPQPLAVCCQLDVYETLGTQLSLHRALVVQPLTRARVDNYLAQVGTPLAAMRQAVHDDPALWELLDTPLMLDVVNKTCAGGLAKYSVPKEPCRATATPVRYLCGPHVSAGE